MSNIIYDSDDADIIDFSDNEATASNDYDMTSPISPLSSSSTRPLSSSSSSSSSYTLPSPPSLQPFFLPSETPPGLPSKDLESLEEDVFGLSDDSDDFYGSDEIDAQETSENAEDDDSRDDVLENFILGGLSKDQMNLVFSYGKEKHKGVERLTVLNVPIIANIEFSDEFFLDVRSKIVYDNIVENFLMHVKKRHSHIISNTLFLIKLQLRDRAYWFAHNAVKNPEHERYTFFGFYPFFVSFYENELVFDSEIVSKGNVGYFEDLEKKIKEDLLFYATKEALSPVTLSLYLLNEMVLNPKTMKGFDPENDLPMDLEELNANYERNILFLSKSFFETLFFKKMIGISNFSQNKRSFKSNILYSVPRDNPSGKPSIHTELLLPKEENIVDKNVLISIALNWGEKALMVPVRDEHAMSVLKEFIFFQKKGLSPFYDKIKDFNLVSDFFVAKNPIFNAISIANNAKTSAMLLNILGVPVNTIAASDHNLSTESLIEVIFIMDVLYGLRAKYGLRKNFSGKRRQAFLKNDVHSSFKAIKISKFVGFFTRYHKDNIKKISAWLTVFKMVVKHGFMSDTILSLLGQIFKSVHQKYCDVKNLNPSDANLQYEKSVFYEILFLILFANPIEVNSHINYMKKNTDLRVESTPFPIPSYFHMGFFTILQLSKLFFEKKQLFLESNGFVFPFYGCIATDMMNFEKIVNLNSKENKDLLQELIDKTTRFEKKVCNDWGILQEKSVGKDEFNQAFESSEPTVLFGSRVLHLNELGNACRRIYLSVIEGYQKSGFSEDSQFSVKQLLRFLKSKNPEVLYVAASLLQLKYIASEGSEKIASILDEIAIFLRNKKNYVLKEGFTTILNQKKKHKKEEEVQIVPVINKRSRKDQGFKTASKGFREIFQSFELFLSIERYPSVSTKEPVYETKVSKILKLFVGKKERYTKKQYEQLDPPTSEEEQQLLEDVLLVTWFVQSPFYASNFQNTRGQETGFSRRFGFYLQTNTVLTNVEGDSFDDRKWPAETDNLQNVNNHSLFKTLVPTINDYNKVNLIFSYMRKLKNDTELKSLKLTKIRPVDIERIATSSVLVPNYSDKDSGQSLAVFRMEPSRYIFTASSFNKTAIFSGNPIVHIFQGLPFSARNSKSEILSRESYVNFVIFKQHLDAILQSLYYKIDRDSKEAVHAFVNKKHSVSGSSWLSKQTRNVFDSRKLISFVKENSDFFRDIEPTAKNLSENSVYFRRILEAIIFDSQHDSMKKKFNAFTSLGDPQNPRVKYFIEGFDFNALEEKFLYFMGSEDGKNFDLSINWNVADTFLAYEHLKNASKKHVFTPLHVFRAISLLREPLISKKDSQETLPGAAEFYAPIVGYVTSGMDTISTLEYNERSPSMNHFAVSRISRNKETLSVKLENNNHGTRPYYTGMNPIYDVNVSLISENKKNLDSGKQRLFSEITASKNKDLLEIKYDFQKKQHCLSTKADTYLLAGNLLGFISGEVTPIEIFAETVDIYDPQGPLDGEILFEPMRKRFRDFASSTCENIFQRETLYPVGEFVWFQYTHTKITKPVLYENSKFEKKEYTSKNAKRQIFKYTNDSYLDITEDYKEGNVAAGPNAYREARIICGYEISGVRFSNHIRFVRYTDDPSNANAEFVRVDRSQIAVFGDRPDLSYWCLRATRYIPPNTEIMVHVPSTNENNGNVVNWRKFLHFAYPTIMLPRDVFPDSWDVSVRAVPIHHVQIPVVKQEMPYPRLYNYNVSLPIFQIRKTDSKLVNTGGGANDVPTRNHRDYEEIATNVDTLRTTFLQKRGLISQYTNDMEETYLSARNISLDLYDHSVVKKGMTVLKMNQWYETLGTVSSPAPSSSSPSTPSSQTLPSPSPTLTPSPRSPENDYAAFFDDEPVATAPSSAPETTDQSQEEFQLEDDTSFIPEPTELEPSSSSQPSKKENAKYDSEEEIDKEIQFYWDEIEKF